MQKRNLVQEPLDAWTIASFASMHLGFNRADPAAEVIEFYARIIRQERHRHARIRNAFAYHQRRQPNAEWVVVMPRMPDRTAVRLPRFKWPDRCGSRRNLRHVP